MNIAFRTMIIAVLLCAFLALDAAPALADDWSEPITIRRRREGVVLSYRAKFDAGYIIVEANHAKGWHTYAMDNTERAVKKSGKEKPETELPTVIRITEGAKTSGPWFQSKPKDLSMTDIKWYTWGFENTGYFAIKVNSIEGPEAAVTISAQACNANSCSMVDEETITIKLPQSLPEEISDTPPIPQKFVRVGDPEIIKKL